MKQRSNLGYLLFYCLTFIMAKFSEAIIESCVLREEFPFSDFFQKTIFGIKNHQNKFNQLWKRSLLGLGFDVCATMPSAMQHLVLPSITSLKGPLQYFRYSLSGTTIKITYLPAKCHSGVKSLWKLHFNFERSNIDTFSKKLDVTC